MADEAIGAEAKISDEAELDTLREGIDDPMVLKEQLRKEAEARRQLTARAKKAEDEVRSYKEQLVKTESKPITNQTSVAISDRDYTELRMQGYTTDDVSDIAKFGGMEALKDPNSLLSQGIKARQEQRQAEAAANGTNQSGGEDQFREVNFNIPRNPNLADLKKAIGDMEKALPHAD